MSIERDPLTNYMRWKGWAESSNKILFSFLTKKLSYQEDHIRANRDNWNGFILDFLLGSQDNPPFLVYEQETIVPMEFLVPRLHINEGALKKKGPKP